MAKSTQDPAAQVAEPEANTAVVQSVPVVDQESFPLALGEFCSRLSTSSRQVELIAGFEHVELSAGRLKDTETAYMARWVEFGNLPA